jgi:hypothetical protein
LTRVYLVNEADVATYAVDLIVFVFEEVERKNNYSSGLRFRAPEGGEIKKNVWEDSLKEHGLPLVREMVCCEETCVAGACVRTVR